MTVGRTDKDWKEIRIRCEKMGFGGAGVKFV